MDAENYLHWLGTTDLVHVGQGDLTQAVDAIVAELEQETPEGEMLQALRFVQSELRSGRTPTRELLTFREEFLYDSDLPDPPHVVLENELREIASGISRDRWSTETYQNFEAAIDRFLDGADEEVLWSQVDAIEDLLDRVQSSYQQTSILPKEVTMESKVTHQLLFEGIEEWREALTMLRDDQEGEIDWNAVLLRAETGNRLLVAVQIYHQRLQSALMT